MLWAVSFWWELPLKLHTSTQAANAPYNLFGWYTGIRLQATVYRNLLSHSTAQKFAFILRTTEEKKEKIFFYSRVQKFAFTPWSTNICSYTLCPLTGAQKLLSHSKIPACAFTNCAAELTPGPGIPGMLGGPPGPGFIMYIASPEPAESATKLSVPRQHCLHCQVRVTFNNRPFPQVTLVTGPSKDYFFLYPLHLASKNNKQTCT